MLNDLQAELGMAPAAEESKCKTQPRTVAPPPCLPLDIKDSLKENLRGFDGYF
jgi:hypothetical protein